MCLGIKYQFLPGCLNHPYCSMHGIATRGRRVVQSQKFAIQVEYGVSIAWRTIRRGKPLARAR